MDLWGRLEEANPQVRIQVKTKEVLPLILEYELLLHS